MSGQSLIVLNQSNLVEGTNCFRYVFNHGTDLSDFQVGLSSISLMNCFFNINAPTKVTLTFAFGVYVCPFPPGSYSVEDITNMINNFCIENSLYLVNTVSGQKDSFFGLINNSAYYSVQLNIAAMPSAAAAAAASFAPPDAATWTFPPDESYFPTIDLGNVISNLVGLTAGPYPSAAAAAAAGGVYYQTLSNVCPQMSPITSVILRSNLLMNSISTLPNDVLTSVPIQGSIGEQFSLGVTNVLYSDIRSGQLPYVEVSLWSQDPNFALTWSKNMSASVLKDPNVLICLSLKRKLVTVRGVTA